MCGGINSKAASAAALWRQGNMLHFGFEQSPGEMNATGKSLLVNAIVYISKFTQDRPILRAGSPFAGQATIQRDSIATWLKRDNFKTSFLGGYIGADVLVTLEDKNDAAACRAWFEKVRPWLRPGERNRLVVDEEAKALKIRVNEVAFFDAIIKALEGGGDADAKARILLKRYVSDGPSDGASAARWKKWIEENRPYLFFSEVGGYRWYIDPLARRRHVPTKDLRGPARADDDTHPRTG